MTANVGGGAWRLKWHPNILRKTDLLVACMHDGFKVVHFESLPNPDAERSSEGRTTLDLASYTITARNDVHTSLAYGADWQFASSTSAGDSAQGFSVIASCSFYDHMLSIWRG